MKSTLRFLTLLLGLVLALSSAQASAQCKRSIVLSTAAKKNFTKDSTTHCSAATLAIPLEKAAAEFGPSPIAASYPSLSAAKQLYKVQFPTQTAPVDAWKTPKLYLYYEKLLI